MASGELETLPIIGDRSVAMPKYQFYLVAKTSIYLDHFLIQSTLVERANFAVVRTHASQNRCNGLH
jgi:hypothetical protein